MSATPRVMKQPRKAWLKAKLVAAERDNESLRAQLDHLNRHWLTRFVRRLTPKP